MKKIFALVLAAALMLTVFSVNTLALDTVLSGPSVVRAGDTITLTLKIGGNSILGIEGVIEYNSNQLYLSSFDSKRDGWVAERGEGNEINKFMVYDDKQTSPITASTSVISFKFKVAANVAVGTRISVTFKDITDDKNNTSSATYTVNVAAPLSSVNTLKSLTVEGATLSPSFSPSTTNYSCASVPFSTQSLNVSASATDSKAKVTVSGNNLAVGSNRITVTVTAENGSKKDYYISVTREQDPNYKASSNADLSSLIISGGQLSPAFSPQTTKYIVYVPYEVTSFGLSGTAADAKATGVSTATIPELAIGENVAQITVTAEDGTTKVYSVIVMRMPAFTGDATPNTTPSADENTTPTPPPVVIKETDLMLTAVLSICALLMGAGIGIIVTRLLLTNRKKTHQFKSVDNYGDNDF